MAEGMPQVERPWQYGHGDSALHRLGAGWKSGLTLAFGALALAVHSHVGLLMLGCAIAAAYAWAGLGWVALFKDVRWPMVQGAVIVALTVLVAGRDALGSGVRTALQLSLVFLPAALMLRTTSPTSLQAPLRRWLPGRLAFAVGATMRFVPVFAREVGELVEMQRLRGARLRTRDLWRPRAWRDWIECVAFPMTVRSVEIARHAAEAAEMRGVDRATMDTAMRGVDRAKMDTAMRA